MTKLILAVAALLAANVAMAQAPAAQPKAATNAPAAAKKPLSEKQAKQQERMKRCNKEAGEMKLKGPERKTFMSGCLKGEPGAAAKPAEAPAAAKK